MQLMLPLSVSIVTNLNRSLLDLHGHIEVLRTRLFNNVNVRFELRAVQRDLVQGRAHWLAQSRCAIVPDQMDAMMDSQVRTQLADAVLHIRQCKERTS